MSFQAFAIAVLFIGAGTATAAGDLHPSGIHAVEDMKAAGKGIHRWIQVMAGVDETADLQDCFCFSRVQAFFLLLFNAIPLCNQCSCYDITLYCTNLALQLALKTITGQRGTTSHGSHNSIHLQYSATMLLYFGSCCCSRIIYMGAAWKGRNTSRSTKIDFRWEATGMMNLPLQITAFRIESTLHLFLRLRGGTMINVKALMERRSKLIPSTGQGKS